MIKQTRNNSIVACSRLMILRAGPIAAVAAALIFAFITSADVATAQQQDDAIAADQAQLAEDYELLEKKLFSLFEYEKGNNPERSKLLMRAFVQSQQQGTSQRMEQIVELLQNGSLKSAEAEQASVVDQLNALLDLLESENRNKRVQDDIKRHQEYLKEVERLLRIQKGIRGRAEGNEEAENLLDGQQQTADRTESLANEMEQAESPEGPGEGEPGESGEGEGQPGESGEPGEGSAGEGSGQGGGQPGPPGDGQPGEGSPGGGQPGDNQNDAGQNPAAQRLENAAQRMKDAAEDLERAERENSIEDMRAAEAELAKAKSELEEILRQLREEEIGRMLGMLEARFRQMLERELKVHESTVKLSKTPTAERAAGYEIECGKLAGEQNEIATSAARALMLLEEDGTSVAFPETVQQMHEDMIQVSGRLAAARAGDITIEIEEEIIETLNFLVEALVRAQDELDAAQSQQNPPQQNQGNAGEMPLVDQLSEIKILRSLQQRILKRHERYSRQLADPTDPLGTAADADLQRALERLAGRQQQLTEIAKEIVAGMGN